MECTFMKQLKRIKPLLLVMCLLVSAALALWSGLRFKSDDYNFVSISLCIVSIVVWVVFSCVTFRKKEKGKKEISFGHVLIIFILALIPRLVVIDKLPNGVWTDEIEISVAGANYIDKINRERLVVPFSSEATGHPGLSLLITGSGLKLFGNTVMGLRFPSAFFGALSVVALYLLISKLLSKDIALLVSILASFSYWHLSLSRIAFEATYYWFFQILAFYFVVKFYKENSLTSLMWSGLLTGLGVYTYQAFRYLAIGFGLMIILIAWSRRDKLKSLVVQQWLFWVSVILVVSPFVFFSRRYPQEVFFRANNVSIMNKEFGDIDRAKMILENSIKTVGMLVWQGDPNYRHNMAQVPMIDSLSLVLMIIGLIALIKKKSGLLLAGVVIFGGIACANGVMTHEPPYVIQPHSLRTLGLLPVIFVLISVALEKIKNKNVIFVIIFFISIINLFNYFGIKDGKKLAEAFQRDMTEAAILVRDSCGEIPLVSNSLVNKVHMNFFAPECSYEVFNSESRYDKRYLILNGVEGIEKEFTGNRVVRINSN